MNQKQIPPSASRNPRDQRIAALEAVLIRIIGKHSKTDLPRLRCYPSGAAAGEYSNADVVAAVELLTS